MGNVRRDERDVHKIKKSNGSTIKEGNILEVQVEKNKVVLKPKILVDKDHIQEKGTVLIYTKNFGEKSRQG